MNASRTTSMFPNATGARSTSSRSFARNCSARSNAGSSDGLTRPFEVRRGDRVPVRIVRRMAERLVDPFLELLRERVLEPVGLVVHVVDIQAEGLGEIELEQPVVADHLQRDALAVSGELDAAVPLVPRKPEGGQLLDHRARGRVGDAEPPRERGDRDLPVLRMQLVDLAQV